MNYKARHILLEDLEDAEYVLGKLNEGEDFAKLAKEYSECESSERGGDLGTFGSGIMDAAFERALYHMKPGEISKPVQTKYGYHIIERRN